LFGGPELLALSSALGAVAVVAAVVGVVFFTTRGVDALVEVSAELGGATGEDAADGPVVGAGDVCAIGLGVMGPVFTQDVCEGEHLFWV